MIIIIMGVAGSGKSTIGRRLAETWRCPFLDADDLHSAESVHKMRRGEPLTDDDRAPWLEAVRAWILARGPGATAVVACSALKARYRAILSQGVSTGLVFLDPPAGTLRDRLRRRTGHYMKERMLDSQLRALEPPDDALRIDGRGESPDDVVKRIIRRWPGP